ncbi:cell death-inducing p53-target protein 1-like [Melanotaenia boesemani]|uniref:cell death-inducing p53-target protein 1-like n=1 Tax=Melanotaenia boesemani TaxID=1250792 RepID=UPI001C0542B2|nr:cell death-inducing p53-target protein 1-like [Melanotaenia boesemani]
METLNNDVVLQKFQLVTSKSSVPDLSSNSEQEQEQQCPPESNQETPDVGGRASVLDSIEFRMQQLYSRRALLLTLKRCIKKEKQNSDGTTEEKDGEEQCELETIQRELEELEVKKKELEKNGGSFKPKAKTGQQDKLASYKETPHGGIYMLPPFQPDQRDVVITATATQTIVAVEDLGQTQEATKCPSCEAVVMTETHSRVGEAAWIICVLSFLIGCVAGCCLIPFYMKRFRNISHRCPMCQAHIHTHRPF